MLDTRDNTKKNLELNSTDDVPIYNIIIYNNNNVDFLT